MLHNCDRGSRFIPGRSFPGLSTTTPNRPPQFSPHFVPFFLFDKSTITSVPLPLDVSKHITLILSKYTPFVDPVHLGPTNDADAHQASAKTNTHIHHTPSITPPLTRRTTTKAQAKKMKILTTNFLTCAVKTCKTSPLSFPLHFKDATLERTEIEFNPLFLRNVLPRVNWDALTTTAAELGLQALVPERNPVDVVADGADEEEQEGQRKDTEMDVELQQEEQREAGNTEGGADNKRNDDSEEALRKLHGLLLETTVVEGKLVCGNCGFEYPIKEGVGNFLLPAHLV